MPINKHGNWTYSGTTPINVGDRYYSPDKIRDLQYVLDQAGAITASLAGAVPCLLAGGTVSKGTGDTINITPVYALVNYQVTIPDTFASFPPSYMTADIIKFVGTTQQTNMTLPSATLDGSTINYIKIAYTETDGNTRTRARSSGSYAYERVPSFVITVDTNAPTTYELAIAQMVGNIGGAFTFSSFPIDNVLRATRAGEITALTENTAPAGTDLTILETPSSTKKKIKLNNLFSVNKIYDSGTLILQKDWGTSWSPATVVGYVYRPVVLFWYVYNSTWDTTVYGITLNPGHYRFYADLSGYSLQIYQNGDWRLMPGLSFTQTLSNIWSFRHTIYITSCFGIDSFSDLSKVIVLS